MTTNKMAGRQKKNNLFLPAAIKTRSPIRIIDTVRNDINRNHNDKNRPNIAQEQKLPSMERQGYCQIENNVSLHAKWQDCSTSPRQCPMCLEQGTTATPEKIQVVHFATTQKERKKPKGEGHAVQKGACPCKQRQKGN